MKNKLIYIDIAVILGLALLVVACSPQSSNINDKAVSDQLSELALQVQIPCPGHAGLISQELKTISGVKSVKFNMPNYFIVTYNPKETTSNEILRLAIFNDYSTKIK